jgi:hypothetical protein
MVAHSTAKREAGRPSKPFGGFPLEQIVWVREGCTYAFSKMAAA